VAIPLRYIITQNKQRSGLLVNPDFHHPLPQQIVVKNPG